MTTAIGQVITKVITIRDSINSPISGLLEDDFLTLEAYLVSSPATIAPVSLDEIDEGQYALFFNPPAAGDWALHHVFTEPPVFLEDTTVYRVDSTAQITVITSGGTWTYNGDLEDPNQYVRFLIQDTDGSFPQFTDSEVAYSLGAANGSTRRAAASLVERLMARYAAMADTTELDLSVRASQMYEHYKDLYLSLSSPFAGDVSVTPYAGGISHADVLSNQQNRDRVAGIFERRYPWSRRDWGGIRH